MYDKRETNAKTLLTLRTAALRLGRNKEETKGIAIGLGINLRPVGNSLVMTGAEFDRVRKAIETADKSEAR